MYSRVLCVFCLLASPALGLDIYEDTTFTAENSPDVEEWVYVHGSASLTIDGGIVHSIELLDSASLTLRSGEINGTVHLRGANHLLMTGGQFHIKSSTRTFLQSWHGSDTEIELYGGLFRGGRYQAQLAEGSHHISVRPTDEPWDEDGFYHSFAGFVTVLGNNAMVDVYGSTAGYIQYPEIPTRAFPYSWLHPENGGLEYSGGITADKFLVHTPDPVLDGDVNRDGAVDIADLNNVRNLFGQANMLGDTYPLDGIVDLHDLNLVRNNFGATLNPVPEPSSLITALVFSSLAGIPLLSRRRRCLTAPSP
jgi:hypothetical protein